MVSSHDRREKIGNATYLHRMCRIVIENPEMFYFPKQYVELMSEIECKLMTHIEICKSGDAFVEEYHSRYYRHSFFIHYENKKIFVTPTSYCKMIENYDVLVKFLEGSEYGL